MHQNRFSETTLSASTAAAIERSPQVAAWLAAAVAGRLGWSADACSVHTVHHSFTDSSLDSRETDIVVIYRAGETRSYWMLVEMKINAPLGENQPQDYVARKAKTVAFKRCDACATVVIAPKGYLEAYPRDVRLFDVAVSLEDLRQATAASTDLSAKLLDNHIGMAMEIFKVGYVPLADALRESQFEWYGMFVHDYKPHLVPNPSNASKQARDVFYSIPDQNRGYITHRIFAGEVSMGFMQRGQPRVYGCLKVQAHSH